jgi:ferredoxin
MSKVFLVTLLDNSQEHNKIIQVFEDEDIIEAAKRQGIELPYACYAGACSTCTGKIIEGKVEHGHVTSMFLNNEQIKAGFILTCIAYPTSNCTILTHQEDNLYWDD